MEKYLIEEYRVIEDERWLTSEDDIFDYFMDSGRDFLDCGQGYYEDEAELICKIGDNFYEVKIEAGIGSSKQDIGDRLYWVECINGVTYKKIDKPMPKSRVKVSYNLNITESQKSMLEEYMKENYIEFR